MDLPAANVEDYLPLDIAEEVDLHAADVQEYLYLPLDIAEEVDLPAANVEEEDYLPLDVTEKIDVPASKNLQKENLLIEIGEDIVDLPAAEGSSSAAEFAEERNLQAVIEGKLNLMNCNPNNRPSRVKKVKGLEKIKNILKMTNDTINDSLFSSDSDVYQPSSSSSDEEYSSFKKQKVLQTKRSKPKTSHIVGQSQSQVNSSSDVDKTQRIVEEDGVFQEMCIRDRNRDSTNHS